MTVKEYFDMYLQKNDHVTFIITRAEKDTTTPFYHNVYTTTPIFCVWEWLKNDKMMDCIILNDKQPPIDWLSGAIWNNMFNRNDLDCMLVISRDELYTLYSKEQADSLERFIDKTIRDNHKD